MSEEFIQKRLAELNENGVETINSLRADKAALEARVKEMEEVCRKLIAYEQAMDGGRDIDAMDYYAQASELARAAIILPLTEPSDGK
jgi:chromosome condensin MukBEF ATPase and DNA-binding subunit MukB